ncbi:MAG TPA: hypothetical protein VF665_13480 [Longimicrobium sp.]|jgi:hypothetical protein|uniref:hypothetical protein n=1 Tax=Longimicrobium sp. TaxID=2029185 RepID=UPI002ED98DF4
MKRGWTAPAAALLVAACAPGDGGKAAEEPRQWCQIAASGINLPSQVRETSGAALDPRGGGVFWTHGDSGSPPELFALGENGVPLATVTLRGAKNRDWEDLALGPCAGGQCLYVADTGDNTRRKKEPAALYRAPLGRLSGEHKVDAERFEARFPGGSRDTEAVFVLPDGSVYLINKGEHEPVELFRWPTPLARGPVELVRVRQLAPRADQLGDRVTGAGASPDGRWVAVRTYSTLALYRTADLLGSGGPAYTLDLAPLEESQGEAVAMGANGMILLTSEAGRSHIPARATWLRCALPAS